LPHTKPTPLTVAAVQEQACRARATPASGRGALSTNCTALHAESGATNGVAARLEGLVQVVGPAVGQVMLPAERKTVTVTTGAAAASSNVILTPLANPGSGL
jgi:hypothetical protein